MENLCDVRVEIHKVTEGGYLVKTIQYRPEEEGGTIENSAIASDSGIALDQVRRLVCLHLEDASFRTLKEVVDATRQD